MEPPPDQLLARLEEELRTSIKLDAKEVHKNLEEYIEILKEISLFDSSFEWLTDLIQQNDPVVNPSVPMSSGFMQFSCKLVDEEPQQVFVPKEPIMLRDAGEPSVGHVPKYTLNAPIGAAKRKLLKPRKVKQEAIIEFEVEDDVSLNTTTSTHCENMNLLANLLMIPSDPEPEFGGKSDEPPKKKFKEPRKDEEEKNFGTEDNVILHATSTHCEKEDFWVKLHREFGGAVDEAPKRKIKGKVGRPRKIKDTEENKKKEEEVKKNKCGVPRKFCLCAKWEKLYGTIVEWVVCDQCGQWFHTFCVRLNNNQYSEEEVFDCCGAQQSPEVRKCLDGGMYHLYKSIPKRKRPTLERPFTGYSPVAKNHHWTKRRNQAVKTVMASTTTGTISSGDSLGSSTASSDSEPSTSSAPSSSSSQE